MVAQLSSYLVGRFASPAQKYHLGVKFPIGGSVMAPGQPAHQAFFLRILRRSRFHLFGHLSVPPFGFFSSLYFITNEERSTSGTLLIRACRTLEPDDTMELCEPTLKSYDNKSFMQWMKGFLGTRSSNVFTSRGRP